MRTDLRILLLTLLALLLAPAAFAADPFVVVVNRDNPVNSLDQATVRKIFLGKKAFWDDGRKINIYLQTEEVLQKEFIAKVLNKSLRQFKLYWRRELYSGTGLPPQQLANDREVLAVIAENPHAISYINADSLNATVKPVVITNSRN